MKNLQDYEDFILESLVLEASQKDVQRVQDIITKSAGNDAKMLTLTNTMCKLITDKNKAFDRAMAADQILGTEHPVTVAFLDRASALGMDIAKSITTSKVLPGSKRTGDDQFKSTRTFSGGYKGRGAAILPCGSINLQTGKNKYFSIRDQYQTNSTLEVWKTDPWVEREAGYKIVITSGSTPIYPIGTKGYFAHDQTGRDLFSGTLVDYIEAPHSEVLIPLYGKSLSCYVYK